MPMMGTNGTSGVLKVRAASGFFTRITHTPAHTMTNAKRAPMLVTWPTMLNGRKAEKGATKRRTKDSTARAS